MEGMELMQKLEERLRESKGASDSVPQEWEKFPACWHEYGMDREGCVRDPGDDVMASIISLFYEFFRTVANAVEEELKMDTYSLWVVVEPSWEDSSTIIVIKESEVVLNVHFKAWTFGADDAVGLADELMSFYDIIIENIQNVPAEWEQIGEVGVDSGTLLISDPAYRDQEQVKGCRELGMEDYRNGNYPIKRQLNFDLGHAGAGVIFTSGLGDGLYPVYAKIEDVPEWGKRITEVRVRMIPHPVLG